MIAFGGSIGDTDILHKNNMYYVSCNNKIEVYSQNNRLLQTYDEITRHKIIKLEFRSLSNTQILILVNKRIILFDIEIQKTVSVLEPRNKDVFLDDFIQVGQNIIIVCHNEKQHYFIMQQELKAEMTQFEIQNTIFDQKGSGITNLSFNQKENILLFIIENKLYQLSLKTQRQIITEFQHKITAADLAINIVLGFADGQILFFLDTPQSGQFIINKQQCLSLDRHFDAVRSISYNQQLQQLISVQYNNSQITVWTLKDRHFVHTIYQMKYFVPVRIQHLNQAIFVKTSYNSIIIYDLQMKITGTISKLPAMRANYIKHLELVGYNDKIYYNIQNACIFSSSINLQDCNIYNHAGRDLIRAPGSQGADINVISFDVYDNLVVSLNKGTDEFLIITQNGRSMFNVYNVIIDGKFVKWLHNNYIAVFCTFGFKLYHIKENKQLFYCGFKRIDGLIDVSVVGDKIYLLQSQSDKQSISIIHLDIYQQKQQIYKVPVIYENTINLTCSNQNYIVATTYGEIIVSDGKKAFFVAVDEQRGTQTEIMHAEILLLSHDQAKNQIYSLCNNKDLYILKNKRYEQMFSIDVKQQIIRFIMTSSGNFVFYSQDTKSGYIYITDEKGVQLQEVEHFDGFNIKQPLKTNIERTILNQETEDGDIKTISKFKFQSNMLSSQLLSGRELFEQLLQ